MNEYEHIELANNPLLHMGTVLATSSTRQKFPLLIIPLLSPCAGVLPVHLQPIVKLFHCCLFTYYSHYHTHVQGF